MSTPSKDDFVAVKKEIFNTTENEENPEALPVTSSLAAEEDEIYYLTEKNLPVSGVSLLPRTAVPVVLRHGGKNWTVQYNGDSLRPRFDCKWKYFVIDNKLKQGDACVFEAIDPSPKNLTFKVHILRGELPPEMLALVDIRGKTSESPIVID